MAKFVRSSKLMTEKHRLIDELSDNLATYKDTFMRLLQSIVNQCDPNIRRHDSQIFEIVTEIINTDIRLHNNIVKMRQWGKRQKEIDRLERELTKLSTRVNNFAKEVSKEQTELQVFMSKAERLKKNINENSSISTIDNILNTAKIIGPAASGSRRNELTFPWMPDPYQMQNGVNALDTLDLPAPAVATHSISLEPVVMTRSAVIPTNEYSSSSGSGDESDE
ncbi:hypothetical protein TRFO_27198 [Tritrichomonas foetus]|uniref:Mediator complex subunit 4 n=1 Tax=Tritrichomonas foetus TaxID=1144522 RepID=A0A1J4K6U6_9EUKA|nr:hypothetical protein TRFO_27198 [Tritrichomonas foetus]|eukprot:OHT05181.1 hypothetical protein TRFO_27198 [Tritrichomonas foetus]